MTLTTDNMKNMAKYLFQMPVRSMTLTTVVEIFNVGAQFQMPVRSMTLTTFDMCGVVCYVFQMPVRSMTLTTSMLDCRVT